MKIIKESKNIKQLQEDTADVEEVTLTDIDPQEASTTEIADAIEGTVSELSDGQETVTVDPSAAAEIKKAAVELGAGSVALNPDVAEESEDLDYLDVSNRLVDKLNLAYATAKRGARQNRSVNPNILVTGLPGSGKTSIVFDWAKSKGVNVYSVAASDPDLEAAVYGLSLRDTTVTDKNRTTKATSDFLDKLDLPNSVLFLDEFNRATSKLRRALLSLVNEHTVPDKSYPKGLRPFKNLLFTVAAVNPGGLRFDKNAEVLNDAEKSRFALKVDDFDSDTSVTLDYFIKNYNKLISKLDPTDPYYLEDLAEYLRIQHMGIYIISHPLFGYDTKDDVEELYNKSKTMLNQRLLTDGLNISAGDKQAMIDWVNYGSGMLDKNIDNMIKILQSYQPPKLQDLIDAKAKELARDLSAKPQSTDVKSDVADGTGSGEVVEEEDLEDDADFFGQAAAGKSSVSPSDADTKIQNILRKLNW